EVGEKLVGRQLGKLGHRVGRRDPWGGYGVPTAHLGPESDELSRAVSVDRRNRSTEDLRRPCGGLSKLSTRAFRHDVTLERRSRMLVRRFGHRRPSGIPASILLTIAFAAGTL